MVGREYHFWVYILSSRSRNLYVGITNSLPGRVFAHRENVPDAFTARYQIHRLVYFEYFQYVRSAIAREKALKRWTRAQKFASIEKVNPTWEDLYPNLLEGRGSDGPGVVKADSLRE
jgi:putative endonuclease